MSPKNITKVIYLYTFCRNEVFSNGLTGEVGLYGTLISGALAGLSGWSVAIPFDVVKNRHQVTTHHYFRLSQPFCSALR